MNVVLDWVKSNVYTVIFVAVMITAPLAMWIVAGNMNDRVKEEVKARVAKIADLDRLQKTQVSYHNPVAGDEPVSATIVVNPQLLDRYRELTEKISADAQRIRDEALRVNRKDRGVLLDELFPDPPMHLRETLPFEMYRRLWAAYVKLLADIGADSPPSLESMREDLEAARARFMTQVLIKESREDLTEEDETWLSEQLTETRLSKYAEAAKQTSVYATLESLNVPQESATPARAEGEGIVRLFDWQWRFWIKQDILMALREANQPYDSVLDGPVKRLVSMQVFDEPAPAARGGPPASGGGLGVGATGPQRRGRGGRSRSAPSAAATPAAADPSQEVPLDFSVSFTGRTSNPLYDVRHVRLTIVVDSSRIPEVLDALVRYNFITIINTQLDVVDSFSEVKDGYYYGGTPVSRLTLELETIWLREWTAQFMPPELKQALGIPAEPQTTG
ncbi:MAG: hypothetical protein IH983_01775 [Planctomycetes bacterium]|nr:hypothetical protein [Planctomycetota bacterium]